MSHPFFKYAATVLSFLFLAACADHKAEEKTVLDSIMATHEKVMSAEDKLMENKMIIDSLVKSGHFDVKDSATNAAGLRVQSKKLTDADEAMDNWMHNFDPNNKSRPENTKLKYLQTQNKQIHNIDTLITDAVKTSTQLLAHPLK